MVDATTKVWTLPDDENNRTFAAQFEPRFKASPPAERIKSVAETAVELLNALRVGQFRLTEISPKRIVIEEGIVG